MEDQHVVREGSRRGRPRRRLRPEVAARLAQRREQNLAELYSKPVEALTEREMDRMRAAFLQG
jgi:hypothetical protein